MPGNPAALMDGDVRETLLQMFQVIIVQDHAITSYDTRKGAPTLNLHFSTKASKTRDFTRMNPPVYFGSKTNEDRQEFMDEVHKDICAMGVNEEEKAELVSYQLKDMAQVR